LYVVRGRTKRPKTICDAGINKRREMGTSSAEGTTAQKYEKKHTVGRAAPR